MTTVLVFLGATNHLCSHRIQVDVLHQLAQIPIRLARKRLIAALKQVADPGVLSIVILAVGGQHSLHDPVDRIVAHLEQQVDVVGHQAIGVQ